MEVEKFRGYVASLVAAACVIGGAIGAVYVWHEANLISPPPETTALFGIFTGLIGVGGTYLFVSDSASRASHASERAAAAGVSAGAALPAQAPGTTTTITTPPDAPIEPESTPGGDTIGGGPAEPLPF